MSFLDLNSTRMLRDRVSRDFVDVIDRAMMDEAASQPPRTYLGASLIGEPCKRKIQYAYTQAPRSPFAGRILRIFDRGHLGEELVAKWIRQAGWTLKTERSDGQGQIGFRDAAGRFAGHCDGVFLDGPVFAPDTYPRLWENKVLGRNAWQKIADKGLARASPTYADQVALYQAYLQLTDHPAVFTALNADTCEILMLEVPFDRARAQAAVDRAVQIIEATEAGETLPREASGPEVHICRFCDWAAHCWEGRR